MSIVPFLTSENPLLRDFAASRAALDDLLEWQYLPTANYFPSGKVFVGFIAIPAPVPARIVGRDMINEPLYCLKLDWQRGNLLTLPDMPYTESINVRGNRLRSLGALPLCQYLNVTDNMLKRLPPLPECTTLYCSNNYLERMPSMPKAEVVAARNNPLRNFRGLPDNCYLDIQDLRDYYECDDYEI